MRTEASALMSFGGLELDTTRKSVTAAGKVLELSQREWAILECLIRSSRAGSGRGNGPATRALERVL
jgi:DNA-binding response OmpR family regulator